MSRWWRAYDEAATDPKLQLLSDALFRAWFNIMCIASKNDGQLPPIDHLAYTLQVKADRAAQILTQLCRAGLLDKTDEGFVPHNWNGRQYKSDVTDPTASERMKRYRSNKRNERNATVTEIRPETEQNTEAEKKKETREVALSDDWPSDFESLFWMNFPNKVGKPAAMKALSAARRRKASFAEILSGLDFYIRSKPPDRSWLNPATFLNQNRWEDQPATVSATNGPNREISSACDRLISVLDAGFGGAPSQEHSGGGADEVDARLLSFGRG